MVLHRHNSSGMFHAAKTNHSAVSKFAFKSTDIEHVRCKTPVGSFSDESFSVMRSHFPDEEDESLARFLIARNGDTSKAIPFLTKSIEWRTKKLPLQIPSFYREFIKGKIYMHGHDKTGHPLLGSKCTLFGIIQRDRNALMY